MSVIFVTLLPIMVLTVVEQGACHDLFHGILRCSDKWLDGRAAIGAELTVAAEVYFFCTDVAAIRREKPIFLVVSSPKCCMIFLSAFLHVL